MALEIFRLVGSVFVDTDKADQSLKKTDKDAQGVGKTFLNVISTAGKFAAGMVAAAGAAGTALVALAENTREYRTEQGKLLAAFETSGFAAGDARSTYEALNGVLGDSGQAIEAANHLAALCKNEKDLDKWTKICTGVYAKFGASLPIEGLTEASNETAKTGALTGALADALNWAGKSEDDFQKSLDKCADEQERQALITETLNELYLDAADHYEEVNKDVIDANIANDKLQQTLAKVGGAIEPIITKGKLLIASVLDKATPAIEYASNTVLPGLMTAISQAGTWIDNVSNRLSASGITFQTVMATVQTIFSGGMSVLKTVWSTVGQPVWDMISQAVGYVGDLFAQKMPEIQAFVRSAFSDIQAMWQNNLQPALQAIGDFIRNVLAPAFQFVFQSVIGPVVDTAFNTIKQLWNGTLKPVFTGILDFITGVFTLNFKQAFSGLVSAIGGIWNGIKTVLEAPINTAVGVITSAVNRIKNAWAGITEWFRTLLNGVEGVFSSIATSIGEVFKSPINTIISGINSFISGLNKIKVPSWVPKIGGYGFSIAQLPYLEEGAVLEKGQTGFLEGNGAEAVVPLHKNKKWISAVAEDMSASGLGGGSDASTELLKAFMWFVAALPEMLTTALEEMRFEMNNREFARLVKAVK